jgi:hypothetical protein
MNRFLIGTAGAIALVVAYLGKAHALPFAPIWGKPMPYPLLLQQTILPPAVL